MYLNNNRNKIIKVVRLSTLRLIEILDVYWSRNEFFVSRTGNYNIMYTILVLVRNILNSQLNSERNALNTYVKNYIIKLSARNGFLFNETIFYVYVHKCTFV